MILRHRLPSENGINPSGNSSNEYNIYLSSMEDSPRKGSSLSLTSRKLVRSKRSSDVVSNGSAVEIDEEEEEEVLEEYITLHRGMITISDDVTSFYLRLGVLGEFIH